MGGRGPGRLGRRPTSCAGLADSSGGLSSEPPGQSSAGRDLADLRSAPPTGTRRSGLWQWVASGLLAAGAVAFGLLTSGLPTTGAKGTPWGSPQPRFKLTIPAKVVTPKPAPKPAEPVLKGAVPDFTPKASASPATKVASADAVIAAEPFGPSDKLYTTSLFLSERASKKLLSVDEKVKDPWPRRDRRRPPLLRRLRPLRDRRHRRQSPHRLRRSPRPPQLARALLQRPPRLPANAEVPKAKVLNVVPGPRSGDTFTLSASLLRVGITSELRIDVEAQ